MNTLYLSDALYNAGLLGFIRVLRKGGIRYTVEERSLSFETEDIVDKFTEAYFEELLDLYGMNTVAYKLREKMDAITRNPCDIDDTLKGEIDEACKMITERMGKASYKAGCEIIKKRGEPFDFAQCAQSIKSESDYMRKIDLLILFNDKFQTYLHVFQMKEIVYTCVQLYWSNVAFLHKQKNTDEFEAAFQSEFISPIETYKPKRGAHTLACFQCGCVLPSGTAGMAWINDQGVDIKRKANDFYGFEIDISPCPLCRLVYACLPLGFHTYSKEGIFINDNRTIESLIEANAFDYSITGNDSYAQLISKFVLEAELKEASEKLGNISVLRRTEQGYRVNILSPAILYRLKRAEKNLRFLQEHNPFSFREVIAWILDGKQLYAYIISKCKEALSKGYPLYIYYMILKIQIQISYEEENRMNYINSATNAGMSLRSRITNSVNEKKTVGLSLILLNDLQTGNKDHFFNVIARQFLSLNMDIPMIFNKSLQDDELFMQIGNAFVLGLNNSLTKKDTKQQETEEGKS